MARSAPRTISSASQSASQSLGVDLGEPARHRRVHRHAQQVRPPERAERQLQEQRHHVEDPALGRAREIDDRVRQAATPRSNTACASGR